MLLLPPISTLTDPLVPYTTLFLSSCRHRLHRHGEQLQCPQSRKGDEGGIEGRPGAYSGWSYFRLWLDGNEPAAPAHRCAGSLYPRMSALRRNGTCPYRLLRRAIGARAEEGRVGKELLGPCRSV